MNTDFDGFLDNFFDVDFDARNMMWLPWVGSKYREAECRTIVLGESVYDYGDGDELVRNRIIKTDSLRRRQMAHGILAKFKSRYLRNFERAVFLKKHPTKEERTLLWSQVIYHNLVSRLLPSVKHRPSFEDYTAGWQVFLDLIKIVEAKRCIVYGLEPLKIEALLAVLSRDSLVERKQHPAIGRNKPLALSLKLDGHQVELLFIRHPSAYFSWDKWGVFLRETEMMPIARQLGQT